MIAGTVVLLIIALSYAIVTDMRYRRIPNKLTFPMLVGGLVLRLVAYGPNEFLTGLTGGGIALAIMIAPFILGWVGAGDVKLAMVVGALMGPNFLIAALLFSAIVAGAIAAADILRKRQLAATAHYLLYAWHLPAPPGLALKGRLPWAPAIASGCAVVLLATALGVF